MQLTIYMTKIPNIIVILSILIILILTVSYFVFKNKNSSFKEITKLPFAIEKLQEALGGKDNIVSSSAKLSKLYVELKDYQKVNPNVLKNLGASGIVKNSQGLTIIFGQASELINKKITS